MAAEPSSRVLFINHTGLVSGAEHSLLTLLSAMDIDQMAGLACPPGRLADEAARLGVRVHPIRGTSGSLRLHPWHTIIAFADLVRMGFEVHRIAHAAKATVLHANSVRAGLGTLVARRIGRQALVVHIRDCLPHGRAADAVRLLTTRNADALIAISRHVATRFAGEAPPAAVREKMHVVDNPVDLSRFRPPSTRPVTRDAAPVLAIIGQITPWKGHDTAVRALPDVRSRFPGTRLLVVGEVKFEDSATRLDNRAFLRSLHELVGELKLDDAVDFLGERQDVPDIMAAADAILVPSVEEPFGRTVAEAMAIGTPVIATSVGGPAELIDNGSTGLLVPPGEPAAWSGAIRRIVEHPEWASKIGQRASEVARERFATEHHVAAMMEVYESVRPETG